MPNTNGRRAAEHGGRRVAGGEREVPSKRRAAPKRRPIGATIVLRFFQILGTLILVGAVTSAFLACYAAVYIKTVIVPAAHINLSDYTLDENSVVYYTDKNTGLAVELITLVGEKDTEWVSLEDIPEDLINAVVAIEDKRFWTHHGVDWRRTGGAMVNMFFGMRNNFGGSTITQQLIKNVTQYDDVTVKRKIQEIFTALDLEKNYSKNDILEFYLNVIYLGSNCYGVQSAAQKYFGKNVSELSLAECASLAGITNNPSMYGPNSTLEVTRYRCKECGKYSLTRDEICSECGAKDSYDNGTVWTAKDYNKARQKTILGEMLKEENGYISQEEYDAAVAEPLNFRAQSDSDGDGEKDQSSINSWYVDAVINEVIDDMVEQTGMDRKMVKKRVYSGGLSIYTNFDPDVQAAVDAVYSDRSNLDKVSKSGQQIKSAMTIVDNATGYVVAIAGDVGEKTGNLVWNYAVDSPFQPGSSFKPLAVYAPALEMGLITPATVVDDNPVLLGDAVWPRNDNKAYKGLTTIEDGVKNSTNTIALRTLRMVTPETSFQFLRERFGLTTLVESMEVNGEIKTDVGESPLAMGGLTRGVTTFEAAAAYATFPRNGVYTEPTTYLKVEDSNHNTILDNTPRTEQVLNIRTTYYMNELLTNVVEAGTGRPARISGMTVAGKTGTTNNSYARWFAGYTSYYTGVVWVGYRSNEEIRGFKQNPAVVMWQKVMSLLHEGLEDRPFETACDLVSRNICLDCGNLAVEGVCDQDVRGSRIKSFDFVKGDEPTDQCTCHVALTVCTQSPILDANGNATGRYHIASAYCPEESVRTVYVVDFQRELVTEPAKIGDYTALKAYYEDLGMPTCQVHLTAPIDPDPEPSSWLPDFNWPWESRNPEPAESEEPTEPTLPPWLAW